MPRHLLKDEPGTNPVKMAFITVSLLLLALGIINIGRVMLDWQASQTARQAGAREAVTRDPIAQPIKYRLQCTEVDSPPLVGALCVDTGGLRDCCRADMTVARL